MSDFRRYAVYYLPDDSALAVFGASWLGWDVTTGTAAKQPTVEGLAEITEAPSKYGFHGTLKPPFRLADGTRAAELADALAAFAHDAAPVTLDGLRLAAIGRFLALVPDGDAQALDRLAFRAARAFDRFRKPPDEAELARRRASGLTPRQERYLAEWGYPFVAEEFRFHLTLTGPLDEDRRSAVEATIYEHLPALPRPFVIGSITLVGERDDGLFQQIQRYALTG